MFLKIRILQISSNPQILPVKYKNNKCSYTIVDCVVVHFLRKLIFFFRLLMPCEAKGLAVDGKIAMEFPFVIAHQQYSHVRVAIILLLVLRVSYYVAFDADKLHTTAFFVRPVSHRSLRNQHNMIIQAQLPRFPRLRHCTAMTKNTYYNCTRRVVISINNRICIRLCCTRFLFASARPIALHASNVCIPYMRIARAISARQQKRICIKLQSPYRL